MGLFMCYANLAYIPDLNINLEGKNEDQKLIKHLVRICTFIKSAIPVHHIKQTSKLVYIRAVHIPMWEMSLRP